MQAAEEPYAIAGKVGDACAQDEKRRDDDGDGHRDEASSRQPSRYLFGPVLSTDQSTQAEHADALRPPPEVRIQDLLAARWEDQSYEEACCRNRRPDGNQVEVIALPTYEEVKAFRAATMAAEAPAGH